MLRSPASAVTAKVTWDTLPGKPSAFPPAAHKHPWSDLTGVPTAFPPAAHTHSYNDLTDKPTIPSATGRWELIGALNVSETLLIALGVGMKRKTFALAGVSAADKLGFIVTGAPTSGCEVVNVYPSGAGTVSVGYYTPALGIAAVYSMPIAVYRIT